MTLTLDQILLQAIESHRAGRLQDAEKGYRHVLQLEPNHRHANHNLGVLALGVNKPSLGIPYLKVALEADPSNDQFWLSYINGLIEARKFSEANVKINEAKAFGIVDHRLIELGIKLEKRKQESFPKNNDLSGEKKNQDVKNQVHKSKNGRIKKSLLKQPSPSEMNELISLVNAGQLEQAKKISKQLIEKFPKHGFGWKVLGNITWQTGNLDLALAAMKNCVKFSPNDPEAFNNLGNVFKDLGRTNEAKISYQEAIRLKPNYAQAHNNLGVALRELGYLSLAEASCREAIRLMPEYSEAQSNLGNILSSLGNLGEAVKCYQAAIRLKPNNPQAHNNLGVAYSELGYVNESEASYREAIRLKPDYAEAYSNFGVLLREMGLLSAAEASLRNAIYLKPNNAEAHSNLGITLLSMGRPIEAEASQREAIRLKPDYARAYSNLGNALKDQGRYSESEASHRQAIMLEPDLIEAHSNLLFSLNHLEYVSNENLLLDANRYGSMVSLRAQQKFSSWHVGNHLAKIRVGFISGDLRNHPVGYFIEGLLKNLDRNKFSCYAFPTIPKSDELTERIRPYFEEWRPLFGKNDFEAASLIHNEGVHVLIDLSGHTAHNRLPIFSYRPAPIQASWLGYFATTGVPEMDYFIGDQWVSPASTQAEFTEKLWNLPQTWLCLSTPDQDTKVGVLPALINGYITFGCFGNLAKIGDEVLRRWAAILLRVPNSKLFLKSKQLADNQVIEKIQNRFNSHGISKERLILEGPSPREQYFEAYNRIDIVLDTFPYPGGTTSAEALWMGVPVLTLKGDRFLSRIGVSIAQNTCRAEWVARDLDDYVNKAAIFASNLSELSDVRNNLRDRVLKSALFNAELFSKNFGEMLINMVEDKNASMSIP